MQKAAGFCGFCPIFRSPPIAADRLKPPPQLWLTLWLGQYGGAFKAISIASRA
jgi:hypothetical protein